MKHLRHRATLKAKARTKQQDGFYQSKRWRRVREAVLMLNGGWCQVCGKEPATGKQLHVDHIQPREQGGAPYDHGNLQVLCASCHSKKTVREGSAPAWMQAKAKAKDKRQQQGEGGEKNGRGAA
jgi:5-methylcytosine-specific restriction endonuclease McrA